MGRLNVGVIGCGTIAQIKHIPHLHQLDDRFRLRALCDLNPRVLEAVGNAHGIPNRYQDFNRMLQREQLDAVLILSSGSHAPLILAAVAAGLHVFVEKPLAFAPREADEVVHAVERSGVTLMVGYAKRYDPAYAWARERIRRITDLRHIQVNVLHPVEELYWSHHQILQGPGQFRTTPPNPEATFLANLRWAVTDGPDAPLITESLGAAAPLARRVAYLLMLESLCHDVNAIRGVLGEPEAVLWSDIWLEGLAFTTLLRFPSDLRVAMTWIYLPTLKRYHQEHAFLGADTRVRLQFPSAYLLNEPSTVIVEQGAGEEASEQRVTVSYLEPFKEELKEFHRCVTEGATPLTSAEDARRDVHLLRVIASTAPGPTGGA